MEQEKNTPPSDALIFGVYSKLIQQIQYFDSGQTFFRLLASTILLGTYASIGFLLSLDHKYYSGNKYFLIAMICLFCVFLVSSLWYMDVVLYERLIISNIVEAHKLEVSNKWLPRVHSGLLKIIYQDYKVPKKVYFYTVCGSGPIILAVITLFLAVTSCGLVRIWGSIIITPLVVAVYFFLIISASKILVNKIRLLY